jgi:2-polyprenyl-6-methoxyphenol hydroxylase-like FAD-dependent oxidoreductase
VGQSAQGVGDMSRFVVCGGGVVGLASALLLARDGHEVTVLEVDGDPPPPVPAQAWEGWRRRGVPQFQQPHNLFARFQRILDDRLPDVSAALLDAGCVWRDPLSVMPPTVEDRAPRPGDERFRFLTGRRPVVEAVFAAAAEKQQGVTVVRGARAAGLLVHGDAPPLRVVGVRTADGAEHRADVVVDAMGRRSPVADWLTALGCPPQVSSQDRGFAYYTRYFAGPLPQQRAPALSPLGSISLLTIPGDGDTWSVTVFGTSHDAALKRVREAERFSAVVGACPLHAQWLDGEPITDVLPMAGVVDRHRRFVVDGRPFATGLLAVGDAWACTNPSAGRGLSVGLVHAELLADVVRAHPQAGEELALAWDEATDAVVGPFFRNQARADAARIAEMEALRDGREPEPVTTPMTRLAAAAGVDADAYRALADVLTCLAQPEEVLSRPAVVAALARVGKDRPDPLPAPARRELEALLA